MIKTSSDQTEIISGLKNNKVIVLPTKNIYQLATLSRNQKELFNLKGSPIDSAPVYFFSNTGELKKHTSALPDYSVLLLSVLTPGPVTFIFNSNFSLDDKPTIACCIPAQPQLLDVLNQLNQPLATTSANPKGLPASTNLEMVEKYFDQKIDLVFSLNNYPQNSIESTVLDCTNPEKVVVTRPGVLSFQEIRQILPKNIELVRNYSESDNDFPKTILRTEKPNLESKKPTVVLGTKEKLREVFGLSKLDYFLFKKHDNFLLLNLGSQTNLENVAKNLNERLFTLYNCEVENKYVLWQDWGDSNWGEVISYTLERFTTKSRASKSPEETAKLNFLDNFRSSSLANL